MLGVNLKDKKETGKPIEVNHAPAKSAYTETRYKDINPREMPAIAMLKSDHRSYKTTSNGKVAQIARGIQNG